MGIVFSKLNLVNLCDFIVSLLTIRNKIERRFPNFFAAYFRALETVLTDCHGSYNLGYIRSNAFFSPIQM